MLPLLFFFLLVGSSLYIPTDKGTLDINVLTLRATILLSVGVFGLSYYQTFLGVISNAYTMSYLSLLFLYLIISSVLVLLFSIISFKRRISDVKFIEFVSLLVSTIIFIIMLLLTTYLPPLEPSIIFKSAFEKLQFVLEMYLDFRIVSWAMLFQTALLISVLWKHRSFLIICFFVFYSHDLFSLP